MYVPTYVAGALLSPRVSIDACLHSRTKIPKDAGGFENHAYSPLHACVHAYVHAHTYVEVRTYVRMHVSALVQMSAGLRSDFTNAVPTFRLAGVAPLTRGEAALKGSRPFEGLKGLASTCEGLAT